MLNDWICKRNLVRLTAAIAVACFVAGCGSSEDGDGNGEDDGKPKLALVRSEKLLPLLDHYLGRKLDGDRVAVASPKGWLVSSDPGKYLVRFLESGGANYPEIHILAEPSNLEEFRTVTRDNVKKFADAIRAELASANRKTNEPVRPMIIGDRPCARYMLGAQTSGGKVVERQFLVTIVDGRRYEVVLTLYPDTFEAAQLFEPVRDAAYAVLAGMKFEESSPPDSRDGKADDKEPAANKEDKVKQ